MVIMQRFYSKLYCNIGSACFNKQKTFGKNGKEMIEMMKYQGFDFDQKVPMYLKYGVY